MIQIQAAFSRQACWELKAACSLLSVAETASQPVHFKQDWWLQWNGNICWVTALKACLPPSHNTKWLPHVVCFLLTYGRSTFTQAHDIKPDTCHSRTHPTPRYSTNMLACTNTCVYNMPRGQFEETGHGNKWYTVFVLILWNCTHILIHMHDHRFYMRQQACVHLNTCTVRCETCA